MERETILFDVADNVATITLNRPDNLNSFDEAMGADMTWAWETVRDTDDIHCAVIQANGEPRLLHRHGRQGRWRLVHPAERLELLRPRHGVVAQDQTPRVETRRHRGARVVRRRWSVLRQRVRHHHLLRGRGLLRSAREHRPRQCPRADRHAPARRATGRRAPLGAHGQRGEDHRCDRAAARVGDRSRLARCSYGRGRARSRSPSPGARRRRSKGPSGPSGSRSRCPARRRSTTGSRTPRSATPWTRPRHRRARGKLSTGSGRALVQSANSRMHEARASGWSPCTVCHEPSMTTTSSDG